MEGGGVWAMGSKVRPPPPSTQFSPPPRQIDWFLHTSDPPTVPHPGALTSVRLWLLTGSVRLFHCGGAVSLPRRMRWGCRGPVGTAPYL